MTKLLTDLPVVDRQLFHVLPWPDSEPWVHFHDFPVGLPKRFAMGDALLVTDQSLPKIVAEYSLRTISQDCEADQAKE